MACLHPAGRSFSCPLLPHLLSSQIHALQLARGLRERLLAGSWWRAPFTATALTHCELFMLPAEDWHRVLQNHTDLAAELEAEAARWALSLVLAWRRDTLPKLTVGGPLCLLRLVLAGGQCDGIPTCDHSAGLLPSTPRRYVARVDSALPGSDGSCKGSPPPPDGMGAAEEKKASLRLGRIDRSMTRPRGQHSSELPAGSLRRIHVSTSD